MRFLWGWKTLKPFVRICVVRLVSGVHLDDLHAAKSLVVERDLLRLALFDEDGLGLSVQNVAVRSPDFLCNDGRTGGQTVQHDLAVSVGHILPLIIAERRTGAVGHEEGHALDRLGRAVHILLDR